MKITRFEIDGLLALEPKIFEDSRGYFYESFNTEKYGEFLGSDIKFVQDNVSCSKKNVLRGLHFQDPPFAQGKLVSVIKGSILDVAVDLRRNSKTYGKHQLIELSDKNKIQFWIPPGFAHGFLSLEEDTLFSYKCSANYAPAHEQTLKWNDGTLAIDWKINSPIVSDKDVLGKDFNTFASPF